ncbi:hypothetical protein PVAND_008812 [Polypedilum vanderplanki]|uniref:DRBM domain-containing protein n=1 Tax=Polypedilum vanderplanki TaxID=319348 RepID=A0A9J6CBI8_POLVA|nr:hypothetical protein PVAND_008812 [Polypedilum vanderplanki]
MIHNHHHHHQNAMHQMHQINVSQPPPQQNMSQSNSQRMNHHHYQQRLNHQQIQQQQQQQQQLPQIRGNGGINNHQIPPPIIQKQHLHQNIATLNQKPPQHVNNQTSSSQNSQIQPSVAQRMSYEKTNNLKRESSSISVTHSATATLHTNNNSSIVTGSTPSIATVPTSLSHHNSHHQSINNNSNSNNTNLLPKYQHHHNQVLDISKTNDIKTTTPVVSANKENIPHNVTTSNIQQQQTNSNNSITSGGIILSNNSHAEIISAESTEQGIESLANAKEKTPMCLVNELARFNKILHQYRLVSEQGPAHKKRFTVILKLGEEEYAAEGLSIKKAQHAAAKDAIMKTSYKHPPIKLNRQIKGLQNVNSKGNTGNITPTVELNALAMKRGEPTIYTFVNTTTNPSIASNNMQFGQQQLTPQFNGRGNLYQRRPYQRGGLGNSRFNYNGTEIFHVALQVGSRTFTGMGPTQQSARHDAAARALEVLKPLTLESESQKITNGVNEGEAEDADDSLVHSEIKSPISLVHEMALKRKLTVTFEVQSEKGPPHMKVYTTLCKVGTITTEGEGNGKKLSKKKAAEKMMEELKKLPPISPVEDPSSSHRGNIKGRRNNKQPTQQLPLQQPVVKRKSRNLIKEKLEQSNVADEINPISQLIQIQQARKEKEPIYNVIEERGTARRREFVIEVVVNGYSATGSGPNKKIAKRIAAENLLVAMGITAKPSTTSSTSLQNETPGKEKKSSEINEKNKKVSFIEPEVKKPVKSQSGSSGRQIVPGLLLVSSNETFSTPSKNNTATIASTPTKDESQNQTNEKSSSPHSNASNNDSGIGENGVSPRDQLNYLAQLIGFSVSYSDFPKANHTEFLSLVTLATDPPHMGHGSGTTIDESRDNAALKALTIISDIGLDNVKPKGTK